MEVETCVVVLDDVIEDEVDGSVVVEIVVVEALASPYINGIIAAITRNSSLMLLNQSECCISGNL